VTYGSCRVTVHDPARQAYVAGVDEGDLWFFLSDYPHSLEGLGPDGCEFVIAFDDGKPSELSTRLVTDFLIFSRTPRLIFWPRISPFQPRRSRKYRCTIATFSRATCRDRLLPTKRRC
jgi:hypothetical protein